MSRILAGTAPLRGRAGLDLRLQAAREAMGHRAGDAKLLLFGLEFSPGVRSSAESREDLELVDLERLYEGR